MVDVALGASIAWETDAPIVVVAVLEQFTGFRGLFDWQAGCVVLCYLFMALGRSSGVFLACACLFKRRPRAAPRWFYLLFIKKALCGAVLSQYKVTIKIHYIKSRSTAAEFTI